MARIPVFSQTILPDRSVGSAGAAVAREQFDINAQNIQGARHSAVDIQSNLNEYALRDAQAKNTTWVNEQAIQYKKTVADAQDTALRARAGNPEGAAKDMDTLLQKHATDILSAAPSADAQRAIQSSLGSIREGAYEENLQWERGRKAELYAGSIERSADNLNVLAYRAGQKGMAQGQTKSGAPMGSIEDLLKNADASAIAGSTIVSGPEKVAKIRETMRRGVITNYLKGLTETDPVKAKEVIASGKYDKELDAHELQAALDDVHQETERRKSEARLQLSDDMDDVSKASQLGLTVPKDKLKGMIDTARAAGLTREVNKLQDFYDIQDGMAAFAKQSTSDQMKQLNTLKASVAAGNVDDVKKYAAYADVLQTKQTMMKSDPYQYYSAHGIIKEPGALNFSDPAAMKAELDARRTSAFQVKQLDGINIPLLTAPEIAQFKNIYETSPAKDTAAMISSLGAMKPEENRAIAQALAPSSPVLAVALATGDPVVSERILLGAKAKGDVSAEKVRAAVNTQISGAIVDPDKLEQVQSALYAYYKQMAVMDGDTDAEANDDRVKKAVQDVIGPVVDTGKGKVFSYRNDAGQYADESHLSDVLTGINDASLKEVNGALPVGVMSGSTWTADKIRSQGRWVSNGDGLYSVVDREGGVLKNKDGTDFVLDARAMEKVLQKNPSWVKGAAKNEFQNETLKARGLIQ